MEKRECMVCGTLRLRGTDALCTQAPISMMASCDFRFDSFFSSTSLEREERVKLFQLIKLSIACPIVYANVAHAPPSSRVSRPDIYHFPTLLYNIERGKEDTNKTETLSHIETMMGDIQNRCKSNKSCIAFMPSYALIKRKQENPSEQHIVSLFLLHSPYKTF